MKIFETILENRNGHYVHAIEVSDLYELQSVIESIYGEFIDSHSADDIADFFNTMSIYCLIEENEEEVYNFDIDNYIYNELD